MDCAPETRPFEPLEAEAPDAAARGIAYGVALSSVLWIGLAITLWTVW